MTGPVHFKRAELPLIACKVPGGETRIARVVNASNSQHMGGGLEIVENVRFEWTTLYDEILFIHEGSMIVRTAGRELDCGPGDIVWLPEGSVLDYDLTSRRCVYFYALYPHDWAARRGMAEP